MRVWAVWVCLALCGAARAQWRPGEHMLAAWVNLTADPAVARLPPPAVRAAPRKPLLLVPSLAGSALGATLRNVKGPKPWCTSNDPFYRIWLRLTALVPKSPVQSCFWYDMTLRWLGPDHYWVPNGVNISAIDFGGTSGIEFLDILQVVPVWAKMLRRLRIGGYVSGRDLRAATFDWRYGPDHLEKTFFPRLKMLVERTVIDNGGRKVMLVSFSMGAPITHLFLGQQSQTWKDSFVDSHTSIAGAFGGSVVSAMTQICDGIELYKDLGASIDQKLFKKAAGGWAALTFMWPHGSDPTKVYIEKDGREYSPQNYTRLAFDATIADGRGKDMVEAMAPYRNFSFSPGVPFECVIGTSIPTTASVRFSQTWSKPAETFNEDGDGTVTSDGLEFACRGAGATLTRLKNVPHADAVKDDRVIDLIAKKAFA